jgi:hypothetical protein
MGIADILELVEGVSDPTGINKASIIVVLLFTVIGGLWKYGQERRKIRLEQCRAHCDRIKASVDRAEACKDGAPESLLVFLRSEERTNMIEEIAGVSLRPDEVDAFLELYATKRVSLRCIREAWPHHKMVGGQLHFFLSRKSRAGYYATCVFCMLLMYLALHNLLAFIYFTHRAEHGVVAGLSVAAIVLVFLMSEAERAVKVVESAVYGAKHGGEGRGKSGS